MNNDIKYLAFYLPQYYETEENNEWWGKGYTEWTALKKAKQLFDGHNQPRIPHEDIGYYDLSDVNNMIKQAKMAKEYGIHGFCYYWYWSNGKRLLNVPVENMLKTPEVDIPFCFCWANHSWTRAWEAVVGKETEVLWPQEYEPQFYEKLMDDMYPYFKDERYIKVDNKNLLLIYQPKDIKNSSKIMQKMRAYLQEKYGMDLYLIAVQNIDYQNNPTELGYDAGLEYGPIWSELYAVSDDIKPVSYDNAKLNLLDYRVIAQESILREEKEYKLFNTVFAAFDNSPRRKTNNPTILLNGTNENFEIYLSETSKKAVENFEPKERFVFLNAWNEWSEGCYLEPDTTNGYALLEIIKKYHLMDIETLEKTDNNSHLYTWVKLLSMANIKWERKSEEANKRIEKFHIKGKLFKNIKYKFIIYEEG